MACPLCGDACQCVTESRPDPIASQGRRFLPEGQAHAKSRPEDTVLIDPEAYDSSEEKFSESLGDPPETALRGRFVVTEQDLEPEAALERLPSPCDAVAAVAVDPESVDVEMIDRTRTATALEEEISQEHTGQGVCHREGSPVLAEANVSAVISRPENAELPLPSTLDDPALWKQEVAARLSRYRARRKPREPRYPSLRLKFESNDSSTPPARTPDAPHVSTSAICPTRQSSAPKMDAELGERNSEAAVAQAQLSPVKEKAPETARIIQFPVAYGPPAEWLDELAEPVMDRPRIVEAAEVMPLPPALGGITLEREEKEGETQEDIGRFHDTAPLRRRLQANLIDFAVVTLAFSVFASLFYKMTSYVPPVLQIAGVGLAVQAVFWFAYQYLLIVYSGSTPGLRVMGLRLSCFDGSPVSRNTRRWRVLALFLSGIPLGLGLVWCYFDEDSLCWHDRITRTYLATQE